MLGVVAVTQAMLPLLLKAPAARIVNISSAGGSLALKDNPADYSRAYVGVYQASKTALNAVTRAFAIELEGTNIKVNAACPGFTATDLSNHAPGAGTVEDAAREPVRLALLGADGPTGTFSNADGPLPWRGSRGEHERKRAIGPLCATSRWTRRAAHTIGARADTTLVET